jgi:hypothetical protein
LEREAGYRALQSLLIFISNLFHVSAAYVKVISSEAIKLRFIVFWQ